MACAFAPALHDHMLVYQPGAAKRICDCCQGQKKCRAPAVYMCSKRSSGCSFDACEQCIEKAAVKTLMKNVANLTQDAVRKEMDDQVSKALEDGGVQLVKDVLSFRMDKLTLPIDVAARLFLSIAATAFKGTDAGDMLQRTMQDDISKVVEGMQALRTAKLQTAHDQLQTLLEKIPILLKPIAPASRFDELAKMHRDAETCVNNANQAFRTVGTVLEQVLAVKVAVAATIAGSINREPCAVGKELEMLGFKLLEVPKVKESLRVQSQGGTMFGNRQKREDLIVKVVSFLVQIFRYGETHSLQVPMVSTMISNAADIFGTPSQWQYFYGIHTRKGYQLTLRCEGCLKGYHGSSPCLRLSEEQLTATGLTWHKPIPESRWHVAAVPHCTVQGYEQSPQTYPTRFWADCQTPCNFH